MDNMQPNNLKQPVIKLPVNAMGPHVWDLSVLDPSYAEQSHNVKPAEKRASNNPDYMSPPPKRARCQTEELNTAEPDSTSGNGQPKKPLADDSRIRYTYDNCNHLNQKMKQLVKANVELATMLLTLIESVDVPGTPKLEGSMYHLDEGETKKAILDRINLILSRSGIAHFPGALGDLLYNDLFTELRNSKK